MLTLATEEALMNKKCGLSGFIQTISRVKSGRISHSSVLAMVRTLRSMNLG